MAIEFNDHYSSYPIQNDYTDSSSTHGADEQDRTSYQVNSYPHDPDLTNIKSVAQIFGEIFEEIGFTEQDITDLGLDFLLEPEAGSQGFSNSYLLEEDTFDPLIDNNGQYESEPKVKSQENSYSGSQAAENPEQVSDGIIGDFTQSSSSEMQDCWLLSAIVSTNNTPEGKQLLKDTITDNGDGTYSVVFAGDPNAEVYTVTQKDLRNINSAGDIDVAILEEAARQYYQETQGTDVGEGGLDEGLNLLTGLNVEAYDASKDSNTFKDQLLQYAQKYEAEDGDGPVMMFATDTWLNADGEVHENKEIYEVNKSKGGEKEKISDGNGHMLSITEINEEDNSISYVDPYDGDQIITQDLDEFAELQSEVVWSHKGFATQIYSAPGKLNVHPKIEALANDMTASEAEKALSDLEFDLDSSGEITDMDLYSIAHNIDGNYSDSQRAAAYRIMESRR